MKRDSMRVLIRNSDEWDDFKEIVDLHDIGKWQTGEKIENPPTFYPFRMIKVGSCDGWLFANVDISVGEFACLMAGSREGEV